jgi:hypothetical protein
LLNPAHQKREEDTTDEYQIGRNSFLAGRFVGVVEVVYDDTELHIASFCLADAEFRLEGADDPAFAALKAEYAGAPPGLPLDRGMELVIETGDAPMPRSRSVKRLSEGAARAVRTSPRSSIS